MHLITDLKEQKPRNMQVIVRKTFQAEGASKVKSKFPKVKALWGMRSIGDEDSLHNFQIPTGYLTLDYL